MTDTPEPPEMDEESSPDTPKYDGPTISISDEMTTSFLDYAMSVIISRAIPDLRDGLKPVHRRILFAMHETGNSHDKSYRKSARPVGDVDGQIPPAWRQRDLRRAGADGAGLSPCRCRCWTGRATLARWTAITRRDALYRSADGQARSLPAGRYRKGHGRLSGQLRRQRPRTIGSARPVPESCWSMARAASPWDGHQHSAP